MHLFLNSRSCIISVTKVKNTTITTTTKPSVPSTHNTPNAMSSSSSSSSSTNQTPSTSYNTSNNIAKHPTDAKKVQEQQQPANVIYVKSCHAKTVKNELEQIGLLDKRYKMISVSNDEIAIPILSNSQSSIVDDNCSNRNRNHDKDDDGGKDDSMPSYQQWVLRYGTELVPFSSSYLGRMKNKNGTR